MLKVRDRKIVLRGLLLVLALTLTSGESLYGDQTYPADLTANMQGGEDLCQTGGDNSKNISERVLCTSRNMVNTLESGWDSMTSHLYILLVLATFYMVVVILMGSPEQWAKRFLGLAFRSAIAVAVLNSTAPRDVYDILYDAVNKILTDSKFKEHIPFDNITGYYSDIWESALDYVTFGDSLSNSDCQRFLDGDNPEGAFENIVPSYLDGDAAYILTQTPRIPTQAASVCLAKRLLKNALEMDPETHVVKLGEALHLEDAQSLTKRLDAHPGSVEYQTAQKLKESFVLSFGCDGLWIGSKVSSRAKWALDQACGSEKGSIYSGQGLRTAAHRISGSFFKPLKFCENCITNDKAFETLNLLALKESSDPDNIPLSRAEAHHNRLLTSMRLHALDIHLMQSTGIESLVKINSKINAPPVVEDPPGCSDKYAGACRAAGMLPVIGSKIRALGIASQLTMGLIEKWREDTSSGTLFAQITNFLRASDEIGDYVSIWSTPDTNNSLEEIGIILSIGILGLVCLYGIFVIAKAFFMIAFIPIIVVPIGLIFYKWLFVVFVLESKWKSIITIYFTNILPYIVGPPLFTVMAAFALGVLRTLPFALEGIGGYLGISAYLLTLALVLFVVSHLVSKYLGGVYSLAKEICALNFGNILSRATNLIGVISDYSVAAFKGTVGTGMAVGGKGATLYKKYNTTKKVPLGRTSGQRGREHDDKTKESRPEKDPYHIPHWQQRPPVPMSSPPSDRSHEAEPSQEPPSIVSKEKMLARARDKSKAMQEEIALLEEKKESLSASVALLTRVSADIEENITVTKQKITTYEKYLSKDDPRDHIEDNEEDEGLPSPTDADADADAEGLSNPEMLRLALEQEKEKLDSLRQRDRDIKRTLKLLDEDLARCNKGLKSDAVIKDHIAKLQTEIAREKEFKADPIKRGVAAAVVHYLDELVGAESAPTDSSPAEYPQSGGGASDPSSGTAERTGSNSGQDEEPLQPFSNIGTIPTDDTAKDGGGPDVASDIPDADFSSEKSDYSDFDDVNPGADRQSAQPPPKQQQQKQQQKQQPVKKKNTGPKAASLENAYIAMLDNRKKYFSLLKKSGESASTSMERKRMLAGIGGGVVKAGFLATSASAKIAADIVAGGAAGGALSSVLKSASGLILAARIPNILRDQFVRNSRLSTSADTPIHKIKEIKNRRKSLIKQKPKPPKNISNQKIDQHINAIEARWAETYQYKGSGMTNEPDLIVEKKPWGVGLEHHPKFSLLAQENQRELRVLYRCLEEEEEMEIEATTIHSSANKILASFGTDEQRLARIREDPALSLEIERALNDRAIARSRRNTAQINIREYEEKLFNQLDRVGFLPDED